MILFKKNIQIKTIDSFTDKEGRIIYALIETETEKILLINAYAPQY